MVDLAEIQAAYYIVAATGVIGALLTAVVGLKSYINANKRAEEARRRELETRQAQLFMGVYNQFSSKEFVNAYYIYLMKNWSGFREFMKLWSEDPEFRLSFGIIASMMEGLGTLVREGLLPIRMVAILCSGSVRMFWEKVSPFIEETRVEYKRNLSESEYLYHALIKYLNEHPEFQTEATNFTSVSKRAFEGTPQ